MPSFLRFIFNYIFFLCMFSLQSEDYKVFCQTPVVPPDSERVEPDSKSENKPQQNYITINKIGILGNKTTKRHILLRELPFLENDTVDRDKIQEKLKSARENLLNTSLFNFVTIDTVSVRMAGADRIDVLITVAERWYTWPIPIFEVQERNFNTWWQTKNFERANYGFYLDRENFRGRKEDLSFYFQFGYTEKYGITYKIPYLTRKQTSGAGLSFSYSRNHEIAYMTADNKLLYFKYPTEYVREEFTGKMYYSYRSGIHNTHTLETKYLNGKVSDTLNHYSVGYFIGQETKMQYLLLDYSFRMDHRDAKYFPLKGYYLELEATKLGLGLLSKEKIDVLNLFFTLKKYQKISSRFYLAGSLRIKFSPNSDQPYYVQRGLGFGDYVRGYEYYVIDGQSYGTTKWGLKYEIIKPKIRVIPLPFEKFNLFHYALYAGIFGDAGYVDDHQYTGNNFLANTYIYGYGTGIDFVTYYDMIFRFEYSFNKMLEHGFFVSFNAGI
ncbi:MAG: hypothetical protein EPN85_10575 [Bacteroidetes bacterium]|nr:MAG: hypothetical protein EPN85_10575 [Bacteroidota bacterium]